MGACIKDKMQKRFLNAHDRTCGQKGNRGVSHLGKGRLGALQSPQALLEITVCPALGEAGFSSRR